MSVMVRLIIAIAIIVAIAERIGFYTVKKRPEMLTVLFGIYMIITTIIATMINIWYRLR